MKRLLIVVAGAILSLALLAGIVALVGSRLPPEHVASRSIFLHRSPHEIYAVVRDFGSAPKWRSDVTQVDVETPPNGPLQFREVGRSDTVNYELVEDVPDTRMVTKIRDTDLGYSGQWTYTLTPTNGGTWLTIREDGVVSNVFFRFMSRYVFGHAATIDSYLTALAKHFGEQTN